MIVGMSIGIFRKWGGVRRESRISGVHLLTGRAADMPKSTLLTRTGRWAERALRRNTLLLWFSSRVLARCIQGLADFKLHD